MAQNWLNNDNLFLQYGTDKVVAENAGDYLSYGANRLIEVRVDLTKLTSTALILSNTTFFPTGSNFYIEKVEATAEVGAATGTTFSVGLIQLDRATIPANYSTAFINAEVTATLATAGMGLTYYQNTTKAGGLIGSFPASATGPYYLTALSSGSAYTTGVIKVRIFYHGVGTISQ